MEEKTVLFKRGGLREIFDVGILYLGKVIKDAKDLQDEATETVASQELLKLETFQNQNRLELKKLGVLEDNGKISMVFDPPDGTYFLFKDFCFIKVEDDIYIPKVAKILKTKKYLIIKNKEMSAQEVKNES